MRRLLNLAAALSLAGATPAAFAFEFMGASVEAAVAELESRGLSILYSSDLVKPGMRISQAPVAQEPRAILEEIVRPHGIAVAEGPGGMLMLVRAAAARPAPAPTPPADATAAPAITEVVVSASRYAWIRIPQPSLTRLSEAELGLAPNVGDDPLRTISRLPGTAAGDLTARSNIRGGTTDETLVRFDGLRLMSPFHLKDFQSLFSAINPTLVGAVDVYTGAFPVSFGDRMSGVIDIHPVRADSALGSEIAVSLYNAAGAAAGRFDGGRGDWVVSARRGNLDRVLEWTNTDLGEPAYSDLYAHIGHGIGSWMSVSANLLRFDDDIELADSDLEEQAEASYSDRYAWVRLDAHPRESLTGSMLIARSELRSTRRGESEQPGISSGQLEDRRDFTVRSLQTDWSWRLRDTAVLQLGGEWRHSEGSYRYRDQALFDLVFDTPSAPAREEGVRQIVLEPRGDQYSAYASLRFGGAPLTVEGGVRWDRSTLGGDTGHWSPRATALYRLGPATSLRASWGRFIQTQGIDELPVSDGVAAFATPQRADHWLLGFEQRLTEGVELRVEGYRKRYSHLRPRFENLLNTMVLLPELKPDRIQIAPWRARVDGIELSVRSVATRPLFWWTGYTWSRAEDSLHGGSTLRSWDQEHAFTGGLGWEGDQWELSVATSWHTGWPVATVHLEPSEEDAPVVRVDSASRDRLRNYLDIDVRLARKFRLGDDSSLTVFCEISNVTNRRNECCTEYGLDDDIEEPVLELERLRSLPLLPSIGVIWKF